MDKKNLDGQREHWERTFEEKPEMFGAEPSYPARKALDIFKAAGSKKILELGCGQGRDTLYFAQNGFHVTVLDYSATGLKAVSRKAEQLGLSEIVTHVHDVRDPLLFPNETFDACYSHMLFCMALKTAELQALAREALRVLRPGGLHIYTVRHTGDPNYRQGIHRGEDMYEVNGFVVHFFSREKVNLLAAGFDILSIEESEEGGLPRKLFLVTLRKP